MTERQEYLAVIDSVKWARNKLRALGAKRAAVYVARSLKSVEGALRNYDRFASARRIAEQRRREAQ